MQVVREIERDRIRLISVALSDFTNASRCFATSFADPVGGLPCTFIILNGNLSFVYLIMAICNEIVEILLDLWQEGVDVF